MYNENKLNFYLDLEVDFGWEGLRKAISTNFPKGVSFERVIFDNLPPNNSTPLILNFSVCETPSLLFIMSSAMLHF